MIDPVRQDIIRKAISRAAEARSIPREHLVILLRHAQWAPATLVSMFADPGWPERLAADVAKATSERAAAFVLAAAEERTKKVQAIIREPGLLAMLGSSSSKPASDSAASLPTTLDRIARAWAPEGGGLILAGPSGVGKTRTTVRIIDRLVGEAADEAVRAADEAVRDAVAGPTPPKHMLERRRLPRGFEEPGWIGDDLSDPTQGLLENLRRRIMFDRPNVVWVRATALAEARRQHPLGQGEAPLVERCAGTSLLVLDDLGWETTDSAILEVLAARYDAGRITLVTTGLTPEELQSRYGAALLRRIVQAGGREGTIVSLFYGRKGAKP